MSLLLIRRGGIFGIFPYQYFLDTFSDLLDFYSNHYDNKVKLGNFNLKPTDPLMMTFFNEYALINLIKKQNLF